MKRLLWAAWVAVALATSGCEPKKPPPAPTPKTAIAAAVAR